MRAITITLAAVTAFIVVGCGDTQQPVQTLSNAERAENIAKREIIVDTHIDVPIRLVFRPADISQATESGDFDYPRAFAGGLNAPFMSIYTPADYAAEPGKSFEFADSLIDMVEGFVADSPQKFAVAASVQDVRDHFDAGLMSLPMGMENGSPLEGKMENLEYFYDRGIRYITLAHSKSNRISDSSYDETRQWNGLSDFGKELVASMNEIGIMIDVSHISDEAFWQVMELSSVPVIASHSSARHFTPGWERNMSDEMIVRLAENGGLIMINFGSSFISETARQYGDARSEALRAHLDANPDLDPREARSAFYKAYAEENGPYPFATVDDVLDHIDHVVELSSVNAVGIGSDYDGVGDSLPVGLKDASSFPNLIEGLLQRGYSEEDIRKILGENLLRVWGEVEAFAAGTQATG